MKSAGSRVSFLSRGVGATSAPLVFLGSGNGASLLCARLFRIDLFGVITKYIGETEKNLDHIFSAAENANPMLFFDEADSLFGMRSEVRHSHDRYANMEIRYLLQKMEEYDGLVILVTNLGKYMDDVFARRMHFTIDFPLPDPGDRCRIWTGIPPIEVKRRQATFASGGAGGWQDGAAGGGGETGG